MVTVMIAEALGDKTLSLPPSAVLKIALEPTESTDIDSAASRVLIITCGANARTIALTRGRAPLM